MPVTINGTTGIAGANGSASTPAVQGEDTNTGVFFPAADTIAFAEGGVEVARFDASGNLGLGVTPSPWVTTTTSRGMQFGRGGSIFYSTDQATSTLGTNSYQDGASTFRYISNGRAVSYSQSDFDGLHRWFNAPSGTAGNAITFTQAMTLDASGNLLVGTTSPNPNHTLEKNQAGNVAATVVNSNNSTPYGLNIQFSAAAPNDATRGFLTAFDTGATRAVIRSNGGLANFSANNVNLSDERVKAEIAPLGSYWDKIKALEVVTYKYRDQSHEDDNIGVIAQQVESVAPEFVSNDGFGETPADGVPLKSIYEADLHYATLKALQEAMARIEALEAALEAAQ
jgi:hypothetical protein